MDRTSTVTWILHLSTPSAERTVIGAAASPAAAHHDLVAATRATIAAADLDTRPRYTLHVGTDLVAIIATGLDEDGAPDHALAAHFADQLDTLD